MSLMGSPIPASLAEAKAHMPFYPLHRDSSGKHDQMRPRIIFGEKAYFFMVCLHYAFGQIEAEKDLSEVAGWETHKPSVNN